ncbi:T9SS type A sorting domain-containing protein [Maribellus sp. CM-23]|uniref:T9SS type A sorting domain-containing protein n=1 Tax=Maribellus sp. CM-23 TaxID=2781026 RepID=UPI001F2D7905|nr:T9SS type A sorting domain-containing protein [Maribellus sp. CM-23]MCE4566297.1 T9SS type A sorting domain-containing protein [Maribellus sp. CM-23]
MKQNYLELPDAQMLRSGLLKRTLDWCCRFFLLAFIVGYSTLSVSSQIVTEGAAVKANFGIDADVYTNYLLDPSLSGTTASGTDDWFENLLLYPGNGSPVFTPSPAFINAIIAQMAIDENFSFTIRMGVPRNSKLEIPSSPGDSVLWIDGVYARDNNTAGNGKDSTAFAGTSDKNFQDPSTWNVGIKDPYQKGDLIDVYGHMREDPGGDVWGIGAFSTRSTSGSVHADFEFFANQVGYDGSHFTNTGTDHGHTSWTFDADGVVLTAGDLIVSIDYEKGGGDPVASIRVWVSETDYTNGLANFDAGSSFNFTGAFTTESGVGFGYAEIEPAVAGGDPAAWAVVNIDSVSPAPPWGTIEGPQADVNDEYLPLQFAEFAINMSFLGLDAFGGDACNKTLGSLLVKTRSSPSFESEMHDFVGPLLFGYDLETKIVAMDLDSCDDGLNQFDLMTAVDSFGDGNVTFYASSADAFANPPVNAISSNQTLPVGDTMFWARSSNPDDQGCFAVDSFMVTVHDNPSCSVAATDQTNFSTTNGTAKVTVTGGEGPFTYIWSTNNGSIGGGQGTDSIYGLSIGRYYVNIVDANGCTTSCNDSVGWAPTAPTCELFTADVECFGAETGYAWAVVTPTGPDSFPPYTYYWYKGTGFDQVFLDSTVTNSMVDTMFGLGAGVYVVEIKNSVDPNTTTCGDTIKEPPYNPVVVECSSLTLDSCMDQSAVDLAFANWLDTAFMVSGGTDPLDTIYKVDDIIADLDTVDAPSACGGLVTIKMIVTDYCGLMDSCEATFMVEYAPALAVTCPGDLTLSSCLTQDSVTTAFNAWLAGFSSDGGCNAEETDLSNVATALACGDSITIKFKAWDSCEQADSCMATFKVDYAPELEVTCPGDLTLSSCLTQDSVTTAFNAWLAEFGSEGGCNTEETDLSNVATALACGDSITIKFKAWDSCEQADSCMATFKVDYAPELEVTCPGDLTLSSCLTQDSVTTAFNAWLAEFGSEGGCNTEETDLSNVATALACGDSITIKFKAWDSCEQADSCMATFKVDYAPLLEVNCPGDLTLSSCLTQDSVTTAFNAWLAEFGSEGGCNTEETDLSNVATALACGDSITIKFKAWDSCEQADSCMATFKVDYAPLLEVNCPGDLTLSSCLTQDSVTTAFNAWLAGFSSEGGCNTEETDLSNVATALACGDSITIKFKAWDSCEQADSCMATFKVDYAPELEVTCPGDLTLSSCLTQDSVTTAFNAWLAEFGSEGGCNTEETDLSNVATALACGDSITIKFKAWDSCEQADSCMATFKVDYAPELEVNCPGDLTLSSCLTQDSVTTAFNAWLAEFGSEGGCNTEETDLSNVATALACGDSITIKFKAWDSCEQADSCMATFKVDYAPELEVNCPGDLTLSSCLTQDSVTTAFNAWLAEFGSEGGCNTEETDLSNVATALACGDSITIKFKAWDSCEQSDSCMATFKVDYAPELEVNCPGDLTLSSCLTQDSVTTAFNAWLAEFGSEGGCNTEETDLSNVATALACGDSITIKFKAWDSCEQADSCMATFKVGYDLDAPVITINILQDSTCNADPDATATYVDCQGEGNATLQSLNKVAVDPSDPNKCDEYWIYTFYAEDNCGNSSTATDTLYRFTESEGDCETAFARFPEPDLGPAPYTTEIGARCFLDEPDTAVFNRWGWTNRVKVGQDSVYTLDVYAGAGQCDLSKGTWVGTVTLTFSGSTMNVLYDLEEGYVISEAHIYAGTNMYPTWRNGKHKGEYTVAPGQYTVVWENEPPATGLDVQLTGVSNGDYIFVIVHSVVCIPTCDCPETVRTDVSLASATILTTRTNGKKSAEIKEVGVVSEGQLKVYPNPFTSKVTFEFVSPVDAYGTLELYNITGQRVARLMDRFVTGGELNKVEFQPSNEVSGIYLYRLDLDGEIQIGRVIYKRE